MVEYNLCTCIDDHGVEPEINVFKFRIVNPENQSNKTILGNPKDLKKCSEFKAGTNFEVHNHMRRYIRKQKSIDELPMLENAVFGRPIKLPDTLTKGIKSHAHKGNIYEK